MTKGEALAEVANHVAGMLAGGTFEESTGMQPGQVSDADAARLSEAVEDIIGRLYRMGTRPPRG